jgi:competence protein ComEC
MMSHVHADHIGGLVSVIQDLRVDAFMEYPPKARNRYYQDIERALYVRRIPRITAYAGQTYRIGREVLLHILYPMEDPVLTQAVAGRNENERSLVVLLEYRGATALLTGDIEHRGEAWLASRLPGPADILKVPHHGSATSSSAEFIRAADPIAAVIQVGRNRYGHPSAEVTARYEAAGIALYRNDQQGAVICTYKRGRWHIRTMQ